MVRKKRMFEGETSRTHLPAGHMSACRGAVTQGEGIGCPEGSGSNIRHDHLAPDSVICFEFVS